jgi:hypothetical protein
MGIKEGSCNSIGSDIRFEGCTDGYCTNDEGRTEKSDKGLIGLGREGASNNEDDVK